MKVAENRSSRKEIWRSEDRVFKLGEMTASLNTIGKALIEEITKGRRSLRRQQTVSRAPMEGLVFDTMKDTSSIIQGERRKR